MSGKGSPIKCTYVRVEMVSDVIVIGAGVEGSAAAYQLIKNGAKKVLLLEQFSALHSRGSSHGSSRITRRTYNTPFYVHMMDEAYRMWSAIEKESGAQLYIRTGILAFGLQSCSEMVDMKESLKTNKISYQIFSGSEANKRYPHQLILPPNYECILEEDGGILLASKCVAALQELFVKGGGVIRDYHKVAEIIPGDVVTVKTNKGNFEARKVIITAGPWGPAMVKKLGIELPFKIIRTEVHYWKVENPEHYSAENFPVFYHATEPEDCSQAIYGTSVFEFPDLLKVCLRPGPAIDPDHRDAIIAPYSTEKVSTFIKTFFKGVSFTPSIYEACIYTESPDWNPVLDKHPHYPNIIIGLGFSGHGFKLSPVIGKILSELALDKIPSYDLSPFVVDRFSRQAKL